MTLWKTAQTSFWLRENACHRRCIVTTRNVREMFAELSTKLKLNFITETNILVKHRNDPSAPFFFWDGNKRTKLLVYFMGFFFMSFYGSS